MDDVTTAAALPAAMHWAAALLTGSIGTSACVLSIAAFGFLMLSGRVPVRRGAAAIIGCFIILSAGTIGDGVTSRSAGTVAPPLVETAQAPQVSKQQPYDPYAFASVRQ